MKAQTANQQTPFRTAKALLPEMDAKQLDKLKAEITAQQAKRKIDDSKVLRKRFTKLASDAGLTLEDVFGSGTAPKLKKAAKKPKTISVPKFENPADKSKTWTGKGRQPGWYKVALAAGKTSEAMEIKKS
jgi:DNA-binding protein H-NS